MAPRSLLGGVLALTEKSFERQFVGSEGALSQQKIILHSSYAYALRTLAERTQQHVHTYETTSDSNSIRVALHAIARSTSTLKRNVRGLIAVLGVEFRHRLAGGALGL